MRVLVAAAVFVIAVLILVPLFLGIGFIAAVFFALAIAVGGIEA